MHQITATRLTRRWIIAAAAAGLLAACGVDQVAGIQGSGSPVAAGVTAVGTVDGFGSIFVDGVEYSTSGAQIRIDDQPGVESQLHVGQIVTLKGTLDSNGTTGAAETVSYSDDLRGPIDQIDLTSGTFAVLGTVVRVTDDTLFDEAIVPAELGSLRTGDTVHVSGFANANGDVLASRVDLAPATASRQIRGIVQSLDTTARTFRINTLTVDYSSIAPTGALANGSVVTAEGAATVAGTLMAARVQVSTGLGAAANDAGRIQGVVTSFVSSADFTVNEQRVITDGSTQVVPQGAVVGLNVRVKVRGTFNDSGVLVASRVQVRPQSLSVARGPVDSVSASTNTLSVLGVTVTTDSTTAFEDRSIQHVRLFRLDDVRNGDYVEVRGTADISGGLKATLVERDQSEARSYLRGVVTSVSEPNFTVLGVSVPTDSQTRFVGMGGQTKAAEAFFEHALNQMVKVTLNGSTRVAEQVQVVP